MKLSSLEEDLRTILMKLASGAWSELRDAYTNERMLRNYHGLAKYMSVTEDQLKEMLQHISEYDHDNDAPQLEAMTYDSLSPYLYCPLHQESFYKYNANDETEKLCAQWYYRVSHDFPPRFKQTLRGHHIVANQQTLREYCMEDISAIALGLFRTTKQLVNIHVRCIVASEKLTFEYANYGDFFFKGERMFLFTRKTEYQHLRDENAEIWLLNNASDNVSAELYNEPEEDYIDAETGEIVTIGPYDAVTKAKVRFEMSQKFVVPVLFAGTQTDLITRDGKRIFTGDVVKVTENNEEIVTAGLGVLFDSEQYAVILDNHCLMLDNPNYMYDIEGSVFYDIEQYQSVMEVERECSCYAQSRSSREVMKLKRESSPCFAQDEWKRSAQLELLS